MAGTFRRAGTGLTGVKARQSTSALNLAGQSARSGSCGSVDWGLHSCVVQLAGHSHCLYLNRLPLEKYSCGRGSPRGHSLPLQSRNYASHIVYFASLRRPPRGGSLS